MLVYFEFQEIERINCLHVRYDRSESISTSIKFVCFNTYSRTQAWTSLDSGTLDASISSNKAQNAKFGTMKLSSGEQMLATSLTKASLPEKSIDHMPLIEFEGAHGRLFILGAANPSYSTD